jgi:hypothetical protein
VRVSAHLPASWRHLGLVGVLLALLLRFAIPTGYMLAGDGSLAIVPCPSAGAVPSQPAEIAAHPMPMAHGDHAMAMAHGDHAMLMGHGGHEPGPPAHDPERQPDSTCPYAAVSAPLLPPQPPVLAQPVPIGFAEPPLPVAAHRAVATLAAPPPPSRGPPDLS